MLPLNTGREGPGRLANGKVKQIIVLNNERQKLRKNAVWDSFNNRDVAGAMPSNGATAAR